MKKIVSIALSVALLMTSLMVGCVAPGACARMRGDVDGDSAVTSIDARLVLEGAARGTGSWTKEQFGAGDYNGDDLVNTTDARGVLQKAVQGEIVDYSNITQKNAFGERAITLLGDSISHGANAPDIPTQSYVGLLKQALNKKTGDDNYGFTNCEGRMTNNLGTYIEMHDLPETSGTWECRRASTLLGVRGYQSTQHWATLDFTLRGDYKYFRIFYEAGPKHGDFSVETIGGVQPCIYDITGHGSVINSNDSENHPACTNYYETSQLVNKKIRIAVQSEDGKSTCITGIAYYNTLDGVVLHNYANSGLLLSGYDKTGTGGGKDVTGIDLSILSVAAQSEVLVFSMGYNDSHSNPATHHEDFTTKINYLIKACKQNDTKVVVNDLCWYFSETQKGVVQFYKDELKRLAEETGGIYVDQQAINGKALLDCIADAAHPNPAGHKMIADTLVRSMHLN